ncbi:hypothetical protein D3C76_1453200 [compost metagenome]
MRQEFGKRWLTVSHHMIARLLQPLERCLEILPMPPPKLFLLLVIQPQGLKQSIRIAAFGNQAIDSLAGLQCVDLCHCMHT